MTRGGKVPSKRVTRRTTSSSVADTLNIAAPSSNAPSPLIMTRSRWVWEEGGGADGVAMGINCDVGGDAEIAIDVEVGDADAVGVERGDSIAESSQQRRGRGPNVPKEPHPDPLQRPRLLIDKKRKGFVNVEALRINSKIFKGRYTKAWTRWLDIPRDVRDRFFEAFMGFFDPETPEQLHEIRPIWERSTRKLFKDALFQARDRAMDHLGLEDQNRVINEDCKWFPPKFVQQELWDQLCNYWMQESFQTKSMIGKKNRSENIKKHCTGSVGIPVHAHRMREQLQRPVSDVDVYRATHIIKAGEFVDDYSRDLLAKYETVIQCRREER